MNIVLIGFMGTGKSAVGRALAHEVSGRHIDTDLEVSHRFGMPIPEIFTTHGEAAFRSAETGALEWIVDECGRASSGDGAPAASIVTPLIISTGGGTPLRPENAALLSRIGKIVWLTAPVSTIVDRVGGKLDRRPLLAGHAHDPRARIEQLLADRNPQYAALADLRFDTSQSSSPRNTARRICRILQNCEDHENSVRER